MRNKDKLIIDRLEDRTTPAINVLETDHLIALSGKFDPTKAGAELIVLHTAPASPTTLRRLDYATERELARLNPDQLSMTGWADRADRSFAADVDGNGIDELVQINRVTASGERTGEFLRVVDPLTGTVTQSIGYDTRLPNGDSVADVLVDMLGEIDEVVLGHFTTPQDGNLEALFFNRDTIADGATAIVVLDLVEPRVTFSSQHDGNIFGGWVDASDEVLAGDMNRDGFDDLVLVNRVADPADFRSTPFGFVGMISIGVDVNQTGGPYRGFYRFFDWNFARDGENSVFPGYDDLNDRSLFATVVNENELRSVMILGNTDADERPGTTAAFAVLEASPFLPGVRDSFRLIGTTMNGRDTRRAFDQSDSLLAADVDGDGTDEVVSYDNSNGVDLARAFRAIDGFRLTTNDGDVVLDWNDVLNDAIRFQPQAPTVASRHSAIMSIAVHDAIAAIDSTLVSYLEPTVRNSAASIEAAAISAAHRVLVELYPLQAEFLNARREADLARIGDGQTKSDGILIGEESAVRILTHRQNDQSNSSVDYTVGTAPGEWQPTAPDFRAALTPHWGEVRPFVLDNVDDLMPPPVPSLTSPEYTAAFNEVKELGRRDSESRTADQTEIGLFWAYDRAFFGPPVVLYNKIAQDIAVDQGNSLIQNARLMALVNVSEADAGIVTWRAKYRDNFWRPITAIQRADEDGNPLTVADPSWEPLGAPATAAFTPPFPAYPSGHAAFGAATFQSLTEFFGRDDLAFDATSDEVPGITRSYERFSQASEENGISRVYLGIHWDFDSTAGIEIGNKVAEQVFSRFFRPA